MTREIATKWLLSSHPKEKTQRVTVAVFLCEMIDFQLSYFSLEVNYGLFVKILFCFAFLKKKS